MKFLLLLFFIPFSLQAFEPHIVTPYPVFGFSEIPLEQNNSQIDNRTFSVWYPVEPQALGQSSNDPWDGFNVVLNGTPAVSKKPRPVIVISHGYTGNPHHLSWLIKGLVHHGFMVLGLKHTDLIDGKAHINHWKRLVEISKMLDRFSESRLANFADLNKIGIAGFSLGGTTAVWIAGGRVTKLDSLIPGPEFAAPEDFVRADEALPTLDKAMMSKDWRDKRIKAAFIMAPAWSWLFDENSLKQISIPTYFIAAENDQVLVTRNNAGFFARYIPHAIFQSIPGKVNHYIFISAIDQEQRTKADPSRQLKFLFEDDPSIDRRWIQLQVVEEAVNFFDATLGNSQG